MTEKKILIVVPTRDRPSNVERLIKSHEKYTSGKSELVFIIDEDQLDLYGQTLFASSIILLPRQTLCKKLNKGYKIITGYNLYKDCSVIGFMGDDHIFKTSHWEEEIIEWQNDNFGVCYGNDLLKGEEIPTSVFIHKEVLRPLGFMVPKGINHYFCDNFWKDLGLRLDRIKYFPDIIIEHLHHTNYKVSKDDLYTQNESYLHSDFKIWHNYRNTDLFAKDIRRIDEHLSKYFNTHLIHHPNGKSTVDNKGTK